MNLTGARPAKVPVVGEHASGALRVLLIQQQLQRLLAPDHVSSADLPSERLPLAAQVRLPLLLRCSQRRSAGGGLGTLPAHAVEPLTGLADGDLRGAQ